MDLYCFKGHLLSKNIYSNTSSYWMKCSVCSTINGYTSYSLEFNNDNELILYNLYFEYKHTLYLFFSMRNNLKSSLDINDKEIWFDVFIPIDYKSIKSEKCAIKILNKFKLIRAFS